MTDKWQEMIDHNIDFAAAQLRRDGEVQPMFALQTGDTIFIVPCEFSSEGSKQATYDLVRTACCAYNIESLGFLSEAWTRFEERRPDETEAEFHARTVKNPANPISETADRIEVVIFILSYRDQGERKCRHGTRRIIRDADGQFVRLEPLPGVDEDVSSRGGEVPSLLPIYPPSKRVQTLARQQMERYGVTVENIR